MLKILFFILVLVSSTLFSSEQRKLKGFLASHHLMNTKYMSDILNNLNIQEQIQVFEWLDLRHKTYDSIKWSQIDLNSYKINPCITIEPLMFKNALFAVKKIEFIGIQLYNHFLSHKKFSGPQNTYPIFLQNNTREAFHVLKSFYGSLNFAFKEFRIELTNNLLFVEKQNQLPSRL